MAKTAIAKLHKGKGSSLTQEQLAAAVILRDLDKTQAEIAQALGCDQATVSRWLNKLTDSGQLAGAFLRGSQYRLAKKFARTARASDVLDLLDRFKSIPASNKAENASLIIQVGIKAEDVTVNLSETLDRIAAGR